MLTCKDFLNELSEYLDESTDRELRAKLEQHIAECPNCWVIADTTRKTIQVFKDVEERLMQALEKKMAANRAKASSDAVRAPDH